MWSGAEAAVCRKRQDLAGVDQQCSRLRLDCYPPAVRDANFKTARVVLKSQCDPAKVDMRGDARTRPIDFGLRMVADELHHEVRIKPGFVSEGIPLDSKARADVCENSLTDVDNIRKIVKDAITPIEIRWPEVRTFELKKRRFAPQGFALSAEVQLFTPIPLVLHLAVTTEVSRVLDRKRGFGRLREIKERVSVL
jgi:hypothetical protein